MIQEPRDTVWNQKLLSQYCIKNILNIQNDSIIIIE